MYRPRMKSFSLDCIQELDTTYLNSYTYFSPVDIYIKDEKYKRCAIDNVIIIFNNLSLPLKIAKNNKKLDLIKYDKSLIFIDNDETYFSDFNKLYMLEAVEGISYFSSWKNTSLYLSYILPLKKSGEEIKDIVNSYKLLEELI
jgi:hypothetical protein